MFDIGATELLLIVVVAVIVIGPKDLPLALRTAGRWIGKMRRMSGHFRAGLDAMVREAEMEDMQKEWDRRNAEIMAKHPHTDAETGKLEADANAELPAPDAAKAESLAAEAVVETPASSPAKSAPSKPAPEPQMEPLPLFGDDDKQGQAKQGGS
ncbi:Sec-independent protein translocase protein TatB [Croceicoccus naphthovorans]|uniref:Sec-independent protein translocase protein TatB n=1 Tax=Croceicoccus naphthovorans TaxID=1348774 RepID=A0A0G3XJI7_9SPHN|nr:Sec-independent protein translocase protein TatB [Croceicoccus naphthovorans]AKM10781.1 hypothetical protein AB433_13710 [Croceicoccus naphthovorans]MBB3988983.1 sec-independent protein translocase protein TatB [Croceicoccus naphthovorans]